MDCRWPGAGRGPSHAPRPRAGSRAGRRRVLPPPGAGGRPAEAPRLDGPQRAAPDPGAAELPLPGPDGELGRVDPRRALPAPGGRPPAHLRHRQPRRAGNHEAGADEGSLLLLPADHPVRQRDPARGQRGAGHRREAAHALPERGRQPLRAALPLPPAQEHHPARADARARRRDRRRRGSRAPRSARPPSRTWPTSAPSRRCPARRPRPGPTRARRSAEWPWAR